MPVEDLIRYFNTANATGDSTLYVVDDRVEAWHGGLHLGSLFQPVVDLRTKHMLALPAILALRPDVLRTSTADPGLVASARLAGTPVEVSGIDDDSALRTAQANGADLGTGSLFGGAKRTCRPTHTRSRNPYNPPSSYGVRP
jgi:EAL domain-containing protein (putative c-di-GMP-specific phosphodiesterase class I)